MKLFDTHVHLNLREFRSREASVIEEAVANDVAYMSVVGFDEANIKQALKIAHAHDNVIASIGWHPNDAGDYNDRIEHKLQEWLEDSSVHMMGEMGLDYHWMNSPKEVQERVFRRQIAIAKEHDLPISIHSRDSTFDVLKVLREEGLPNRGGVMHSFSGNVTDAQNFLDLGMHLSFSGVVTYRSAHEIQQAVLITPEDRLLIETDAPYLTPQPKRGQRNQPAYVKHVAEKIAEIREESLEEVGRYTTQNAFDLFQWCPEND